MEMYEIYWILKLDAIRDYLGLIGFFCVVLSLLGIAAFVLTFDADFEDNVSMSRRFARSIVVSVWVGTFLVTVMSLAIPTTKQYLTMMGGNFLTTNDKVITTTEKGFELLDQYLDEKLKGATNETEPSTTD